MKSIGMKFSLWTDNGALNSKPIFTAFATSLHNNGHSVLYNDMAGDIHVIWSVLWYGRMAPNKTVWDEAQRQGKPVIVLEVGGIKRGTTWKVGLNGINREANFGPMGNDDSRVSKLGIKNNDHIVVYDNSDVLSESRCWFTFLYFGHDMNLISVLDGGLKKWKLENRPLSNEKVSIIAVSYTHLRAHEKLRYLVCRLLG